LAVFSLSPISARQSNNQKGRGSRSEDSGHREQRPRFPAETSFIIVPPGGSRVFSRRRHKLVEDAFPNLFLVLRCRQRLLEQSCNGFVFRPHIFAPCEEALSSFRKRMRARNNVTATEPREMPINFATSCSV